MSVTVEQAAEVLNERFEHGLNGYKTHRCRGPICTAAANEATRRKRAERRAIVADKGLPENIEHGASAYTNWGCRCDECRAGHAAETSKYK